MQEIKTQIKYSKEERETHLWYDPGRKLWTMESNISKHFNKALRSGWTAEKKFVYDDGTVASMLLTASERGITIKTPEKRQVSEKQRNNFARLKNADIFDDSED